MRNTSVFCNIVKDSIVVIADIHESTSFIYYNDIINIYIIHFTYIDASIILNLL